MKQKLLSIFLVCVLMASVAIAQDKRITGKVTAKEDGLPLPGVSVKVLGTQIGTQTDVNGNYSLNVPSTARSLEISFIGFSSQTVTIGTKTIINTALDTDAKQLSEVVVVGYGSAKRADNVVGSITTVSGKVIEARPVANAFDALQGRVAGLQVFTSSGEPSAASSVRLHGVGSLGASSTPLYLLDGNQVDPGTIVSINPNDIENISVLKDASATSIYGSRAANGVISITTKQGQSGKSEIRVTSQYGVSNLANVDFFENFMNTKELTDFWIETAYRTPVQVTALLTQYPNDFQWYKAYYEENAPTLQTDVSISGGSGKTTYYISGSQFKQEGLAYRSNFERYTLRSNVTSKVNDWMEVGMKLFMGSDDRQLNPYGANSTNRGLALLAAPFYSPFDANGVEYPDLIPGWNRYSPRYLANTNQSTGNNVQFNPSAYLQITPIKGLTFKAQGGLDASDYITSARVLPSFVGSINNGNASENLARSNTKTLTATGEYRFSLKTKNNFSALVGYEYNDNTSKGFNVSSTGQSDDRLTLIGAGPNNRNGGSFLSEYAYKSIFSRVEYNYNNRYYLDASLRQDESSRFGANNRSATFYSVGGMWKVKQEKFLKDLSWLTDLTIKASTGTSGNSAIGNYESQALVGNNIFNGASGFGISTAGNPDLSWETQQNTTIGLRTSFYDRIRVELDYYIRNTRNMLIDVPFPLSTGFGNITSNVGTLTNTGIDLGLNFDVLKANTKRTYITPYVNFNINRNEITELFQGRDFYIIPNTGVSWAVGQPVSYFYPIFSGINPTNGNPEWFRPNSDPTKIVNNRQDPSDVASTFSAAALQQNTGIERYPWLNGGFGMAAGYKGIYLNVDFSFSEGKYMINNDRFFFENPVNFPGFNQRPNVRDYWKAPGDVTEFPKYGVQFTQFDSRLIEDASFVRLKNVQLGYDLPTSLFKSIKAVKGAKVFLVGRNLLTFTQYTGPDPEADTNVSLGVNPNTSQVSFGLEVKF